MIIHNIYIIAWYILWTYFLICICIKLFADRKEYRRCRKKQEYIQKFFSMYTNSIHPKTIKRILKYSKDDILFDNICECYFDLKRTKGVDAIPSDLKYLMGEIFKQKIQSLPENDLLLQYLLLINIYKSGLESEIFNSTQPQYIKTRAAKQLWSDTYRKKIILLYREQGDFRNAYSS